MTREQIFDIITRNSCEILPELEGHPFRNEDRLSDLGANSVDRAEIVMMTMEALSLRFPKIELAGARNIGDLADIFYGKFHAL